MNLTAGPRCLAVSAEKAAKSKKGMIHAASISIPIDPDSKENKSQQTDAAHARVRWQRPETRCSVFATHTMEKIDFFCLLRLTSPKSQT
ncbi:MAG: hypothetical protein JW808_03900, partial [Victivallales bacterium]|nr:hypothetical protein [Victivallales bacterium]